MTYKHKKPRNKMTGPVIMQPKLVPNMLGGIDLFSAFS